MGKRGVPSWELAYLPLRHVWRWFSSSQGEICYFPGRYPGIQELIWRSEVLIAGFNSDFYFSCNTTFPFWSLGERFWVCEAFLQWYLEAYSLLLMDQLIVISSRGLWELHMSFVPLLSAVPLLLLLLLVLLLLRLCWFFLLLLLQHVVRCCVVRCCEHWCVYFHIYIYVYIHICMLDTHILHNIWAMEESPSGKKKTPRISKNGFRGSFPIQQQ